jgi:hypothetical protein
LRGALADGSSDRLIDGHRSRRRAAPTSMMVAAS